MPPKNSKTVVGKRPSPLVGKKRASLRINTKPDKPPPDTSRIPWFQTTIKTGTKS